MALTEEEAKTKECCGPPGILKAITAAAFVTNVTDFDTPYAKKLAAELDGGSKCIASRCMAWRWDPLTRYQDEPGKVRDVSGYCGLAGKP